MFTTIALFYARFSHKNKIAGRLIELSVIGLFFGAISTLCVTTSVSVMKSMAGVITIVFLLIYVLKRADDIRKTMPD